MALTRADFLNGWQDPLFNGQADTRGILVHTADMVNLLKFGKSAYGAPATGDWLFKQLGEILDAVKSVSVQMTDAQVDAVADKIAAKLVSGNDNPLTADHNDIIVTAVKQALREGVS